MFNVPILIHFPFLLLFVMFFCVRLLSFLIFSLFSSFSLFAVPMIFLNYLLIPSLLGDILLTVRFVTSCNSSFSRFFALTLHVRSLIKIDIFPPILNPSNLLSSSISNSGLILAFVSTSLLLHSLSPASVWCFSLFHFPLLFEICLHFWIFGPRVLIYLLFLWFKLLLLLIVICMLICVVVIFSISTFPVLIIWVHSL